MAGSRFAAGRFALELDGTMSGFLKSVEGGAIAADVIVEPAGSGFPKKHIGQPRYEELALRLDLSLEKAVYQWIADSWAGKAPRHDGSIVAVSSQGKAVSEREFVRAFLSEVTVSAADAASKEPGFLTVKLQPETLRTKKGSGEPAKAAVAAKAKAWLPANFKLEIDGLDCKKVSKIDALTFRQKLTEGSVRERRVRTKEPTSMETPNLRITFAESSSQTWTAWFDDFVVKGNSGDENEKSGKLSFLAPDLKSVLAEISFFNLGIFRLEPEPQAVDAQAIARIRADLYCERIELTVP